MKIGIMLRAVGEVDGPGIATRNLIQKLIQLDRHNQYVLFYKGEQKLPGLRGYPNVKELVVKSGSKLVYDQILIPILSRREKIELIFNTKFTVPLLTNIRSIIIMRGSEYWIYPEYYDKLDLFYVKTFFPLYTKKAVKIITLSNVLKNDLHSFLRVPLHKMITVYSAPHEGFKPIEDKSYLEEVRSMFGLPHEKFVLAVVKTYSAVGSKRRELYPGKNIEGIIEAFLKCMKTVEKPIKLVFVGKNVKEALAQKYGREFAEAEHFVFPGYVAQDYLPAIYNLASVLLFPSFYESFGIPLVEALACGCPVVTSTTGSCPEIVGDAAIKCDPSDTDALEQGVHQILLDERASEELKRKGLLRAGNFTWEKSALSLLEIFDACASGRS